jgi:hypothetical protein
MHIAMSSWNSSLHAYGMNTFVARQAHGDGVTQMPQCSHGAAYHSRMPNTHIHTQVKQADVHNAHLHNAGVCLVNLAVVCLLLQVGNSNQAAALADMNTVRVALIE